MQPKVKITLTVLTFVAMVLTGLAAAEQMPGPSAPRNEERFFNPGMISLSPKVLKKKAPVAPTDSIDLALPVVE
ncbi:MAG: hypothetical protein SFV22_13880 [Saprospiraceae bacterium]|nr:hypothetical protein [Saprospiraceae bacterium]